LDIGVSSRFRRPQGASAARVIARAVSSQLSAISLDHAKEISLATARALQRERSGLLIAER
jgi:hypothetical protein